MIQSLLVLRVLWGAMVASTVVVFGVALFVPLPSPAGSSPLPLILTAVALVLAPLSYVVPSWLRRAACARVSVRIIEQADPDASPILPYRDAPRRRVLADVDHAQQVAIMAHAPAMIVACAFCEAIALLGFVIAFLGHSTPLALGLFGLSWLAFLPHYPTLARVRRALEQAKDAVFPR